jgi:hypothetical protein
MDEEAVTIVKDDSLDWFSQQQEEGDSDLDRLRRTFIEQVETDLFDLAFSSLEVILQVQISTQLNRVGDPHEAKVKALVGVHDQVDSIDCG